MVGLDLIVEGSDHDSCDKAKNDLGDTPRDAWDAVDKAYDWYKNNILK